MKLASHFTSCLFSFDVREAMKRGLNRPTDRRILKIILLGFRIQSEISTDLRILNLQRFAVSSIFWVRILDFACEEVRIVDRKGCQKCVVSGYVYFFLSRPDETHFMSRIREIITNYGQHEERGRICITWQTPSKLHGLVNMLVLKNKRLVWKRLCVRNKVFNRLEAPQRKPSLSIAFNTSSKTKNCICALTFYQATWLTYRERWFKWVTAIRIT